MHSVLMSVVVAVVLNRTESSGLKRSLPSEGIVVSKPSVPEAMGISGLDSSRASLSVR